MPVLVPPTASTRRRVLTQVVGIPILSTGVALMVRAEVGVAPYDTVLTGLRDTLGVPIGLVGLLFPLLFVGAGHLVATRSRVGLGTFLDVGLIGPLLGLILHAIPHVEPMAVRIGMFVPGFLLGMLGIALLIVPDLGVGPVEVLMLAAGDHGIAVARARTAIEIGLVVAGALLGGRIGFGTLAVAVLTGPTLRRMLTFLGFDEAQAAIRSDAATPSA